MEPQYPIYIVEPYRTGVNGYHIKCLKESGMHPQIIKTGEDITYKQELKGQKLEVLNNVADSICVNNRVDVNYTPYCTDACIRYFRGETIALVCEIPIVRVYGNYSDNERAKSMSVHNIALGSKSFELDRDTIDYIIGKRKFVDMYKGKDCEYMSWIGFLLLNRWGMRDTIFKEYMYDTPSPRYEIGKDKEIWESFFNINRMLGDEPDYSCGGHHMRESAMKRAVEENGILETVQYTRPEFIQEVIYENLFLCEDKQSNYALLE